MDLFTAIITRHVCRNFDLNKTVDDKLLDKLIKAGKTVPSAGGLKDQRFTIIKDPKQKKIIKDATYHQRFDITEASAIIVISSDIEVVEAKYGDRGKNLYAAQDVAISGQNILLAATALGLNTGWVGSFDEAKIKHGLKLPPNYRPMTLIPVGYELKR